jgi:hypothetical protein
VSSRCYWCGTGRSARFSGRSAYWESSGWVSAKADDTSSIYVSLPRPVVMSF